MLHAIDIRSGFPHGALVNVPAATKKHLWPRSPEDTAPGLTGDASIWALLAANGVTLFVAVTQGWHLMDLMSVYWLQSVAIGGSYFMRIMSLEKFSTKNFRINDRSVEPTPKTKRQTAFFFLMHYGIFHGVYLVFIVTDSDGGFELTPGLVVCAIAFAIDHMYSYRYNRELDRQGTPNIGTMMFTPYLRIIPMHIAIVIGAVAMSSAGVLLFGVLKTFADVAMHYVEHRVLGRRSEARTLP
jgi:hypothetical protein